MVYHFSRIQPLRCMNSNVDRNRAGFPYVAVQCTALFLPTNDGQVQLQRAKRIYNWDADLAEDIEREG
jgi:hypothetical protein